jgi:hypothetical protein
MDVVENVDGADWWMKPETMARNGERKRMISLDMEKEDFLIIYEPLECSYFSGNYVS